MLIKLSIRTIPFHIAMNCINFQQWTFRFVLIYKCTFFIVAEIVEELFHWSVFKSSLKEIWFLRLSIFPEFYSHLDLCHFKLRKYMKFDIKIEKNADCNEWEYNLILVTYYFLIQFFLFILLLLWISNSPKSELLVWLNLMGFFTTYQIFMDYLNLIYL